MLFHVRYTFLTAMLICLLNVSVSSAQESEAAIEDNSKLVEEVYEEEDEVNPDKQERVRENSNNSIPKDLYEGFNIPMPEMQLFTKDAIIQNMQYIEDLKPWDDIYSGHILFIPKSWYTVPKDNIRNVTLENRILGQIARFESDPNDVAKSYIVVEAYELKHNISAKNWLLRHLVDYGYLIEGVQEIDWYRAAALGTVFKEEEIDYKNYIVAIRSGQRIIMMRFATPFFLWEQEKNLQATVAKSFKTILKDSDTFEEMLTYDITGYVEFKYPGNLSLGNLNQSDFERPYVRLINLEDTQEKDPTRGNKVVNQMSKGILQIRTILHDITETTMVEELQKEKDSIQQALSIKINEKRNDVTNIIFPVSTELNVLEVYNAESIQEKNDGYEFWLAYMKSGEAYYIVSMITPTIDRRYFAWIENKNAFEAIVSSIEPLSFYEE